MSLFVFPPNRLNYLPKDVQFLSASDGRKFGYSKYSILAEDVLALALLGNRRDRIGNLDVACIRIYIENDVLQGFARDGKWVFIVSSKNKSGTSTWSAKRKALSELNKL